MKSGSWSSWQAALPPEARIGGEREDEPVASHNIVPTQPGFYWALWTSPAPGTHEAAEITFPVAKWEIVEVWINRVDPCEADKGEEFGVSVTGVRESQWLHNFRWDVGPSGKCEPIPEPGNE